MSYVFTVLSILLNVAGFYLWYRVGKEKGRSEAAKEYLLALRDIQKKIEESAVIHPTMPDDLPLWGES